MKDKKYFKTTYTIEVLTTKETLTDMGLKDIAYECTDGECSGEIKKSVIKVLTRKQMAKALEEQGSDPNFLLEENMEFQL